MPFILSLAWKNLSRYRRRTVITAIAIAVGLAIYILMDSILVGAAEESERNILWYETGSGKVVTDEYRKDPDLLSLRDPVENPEAVRRELSELGIPSTPRTLFRGELIVYRDPYPEDGSMIVSVYAVDPTTDGEVFRFRETVTAGRYLEPGDEGVVLGGWLAEDIGAEVGYPVTIVTRTRQGYYQTLDLEVVGIASVPNPVVNRGGVLMAIDTADLYLQMDGAVTEIAMRFPPSADPDRTADRIEARLAAAGRPDLTAASWRELAERYIALTQQKSAGNGIILLLVFVIAAVGVSNTMLMTVLERTRELGMMRALGMRDRSIRRLLLLEAAGIGFIGSVAGIILGSIANLFLVRNGIDYSWMMRDMDLGYRTLGIFRGTWNLGTIATAFAVGIVLSVAVAVISTRRAVRMGITDALRQQ